MNDEPSIPANERSVFTREEFCKRNNISFSTFNKLQHQASAPAMMRLGPLLIRISAEAEQEWRMAMQHPTGAEAELQDRMKQTSSIRSKKAGGLAVQSPIHISNVRKARSAARHGTTADCLAAKIA
jgi:hypothetical protein